MRKSLPILLLLSLLLSACREEREDPERRAVREAAARAACVAEDLALTARENLAALEPLAGADGAPGGAFGAAHTFARAYRDYAEFRAAALAYADSALRARAPADSARYAARAAQYALSEPTPGTMEANVATQYARQFEAVLRDPTHFCNREPLERE